MMWMLSLNAANFIVVAGIFGEIINIIATPNY
jgi:hypothetical protein